MQDEPADLFLSEESAIPTGEAALVEAQIAVLTAGEFAIESATAPAQGHPTGLPGPVPPALLVLRGRLLRPSAELFPRWLRELKMHGYTPMLRSGPAEDPGQVSLYILRGVAKREPERLTTVAVLFLLTVVSTLFAGSLFTEAGMAAESMLDLLNPRVLLGGWPFALALLSILLAHELGHYFAARYHGVAVTLPYFIPMPLGFGTMGAVIRMREPLSDRRKLFDVGVAGPLAGLVLALPLWIAGLLTSSVMPVTGSEGVIFFGNSLLTRATDRLVFGWLRPDIPAGFDVFLNQVGFAAWIGLLVTAINLLPVGQLDGGHTVFALFGERARRINLAALGLMTLLGLAGLPPVQALIPGLESFGFLGWLMWAFLIVSIIGPFHPPALDDVTELNAGRRMVGFVVLLIMLLIFIPVPVFFP